MSSPTAANVEKVHVTRTPGVCGGKPCIAGTRIRVWDIFEWHELAGRSVPEILAAFPQLTAADVHAALAYFFDHEAEVRAEIEADEKLAAEMRAKAGPSKLDAYRDQSDRVLAGDEISPR
jgi:uncharacterized protein (DUF433 family)